MDIATRALVGILAGVGVFFCAIFVSAFATEVWRGWLRRCLTSVWPQVLRSTAFPTKDDAKEFWGQARAFRYFVACIALVVSFTAAVLIGASTTNAVLVASALATALFVTLRFATDHRLHRSRRRGGWGVR